MNTFQPVPLNRYTFTLVKQGEDTSSVKDTLQAYAETLVDAYELLRKERRRQNWQGLTFKLLNVELHQTAYNHIRVTGAEGPSLWYMGPAIGFQLR